MTYYVEKKLALGSIRFGVGRRRTAEAIDDSPELSTGGAGEFIRRRNEGFYFGGEDRFNKPVVPELPSIRSTPFWTSIMQRRGLLGLAAAGGVLFLLGVAVVANHQPAGWVEVILGLALMGVPIGLTAQERKKLREGEERMRAEREAIEKRHREMLTAYTTALERVQHDHGDEALQQLVNEHPDLPYNVWSPGARRVILLIGFDELARKGVAHAAEVARIMDRVSRTAGLTPEHEAGVKMDLYGTLVWHLLADDRFGPTQQKQLAAIREAFKITDPEVPEKHSIEQFERLRGVTTANLPRQKCSIPLGFNEYCIHQTQSDQGLLYITSKQLTVQGKKQRQHALRALSEVTVTADESVIATRDTDTKKDVRLKVEDPIYTAAMVDFASSIDERPRGFA